MHYHSHTRIRLVSGTAQGLHETRPEPILVWLPCVIHRTTCVHVGLHKQARKRGLHLTGIGSIVLLCPGTSYQKAVLETLDLPLSHLWQNSEH